MKCNAKYNIVKLILERKMQINNTCAMARLSSSTAAPYLLPGVLGQRGGGPPLIIIINIQHHDHHHNPQHQYHPPYYHLLICCRVFWGRGDGNSSDHHQPSDHDHHDHQAQHYQYHQAGAIEHC